MDVKTFCAIAIAEAKTKAKLNGQEFKLAQTQQTHPNSFKLFNEINKQHGLGIRPVVDEEESKRTYFILYDNAVRLIYTSGLISPEKSADPTLIAGMLMQSGLSSQQYMDGRAFTQIFADYNNIEQMVVFNLPGMQNDIKKARALKKKRSVLIEMGMELDEDDKKALKKLKSIPSLEYLFKPLSEKMEELMEFAKQTLGEEKASQVVGDIKNKLDTSSVLQAQVNDSVHVIDAFLTVAPNKNSISTTPFKLEGVERYIKDVSLKNELY